MTIAPALEPIRSESDVADAPHEAGLRVNTRSLANRRWLGLAFSLVALATPLIGGGAEWSAVALLAFGGLAATAATSSANTPTRLTVLGWLPTGVLSGLFGATAAGLTGAAMGVQVWGNRGAALMTWSVIVALPLIGSLVRGGRVRLVPSAPVAAVSAVALAMVPAILLTRPFEVWARIVTFGTDFARHSLFVDRIAEEGLLDYSTSAYPSSLHATIALLSQAAGGADSYAESWRATQVVFLVLVALLVAGASMVADRAMAAMGGSRTARAVLSVVAPLMIATAPITTSAVGDGYLTTIQAGLVLVALGGLVWDGGLRLSTTAVAGAVLSSALMANTWLLLLPAVALPAGAMTLTTIRRAGWRGRAVVGGAALLATLVAVPVVLASLSQLGPSAASTPGGTSMPTPGLAWLGLVLLAGLGTAIMNRRAYLPQAHAYLLLLIGILVVVGYLLLGGGSRYYLIKTAWTPAFVLIGLALPAAAWALSQLPAKPRVAGLAGAAVATMVVLPGHAAEAGRVFTGDHGRAALVIPTVESIKGGPWLPGRSTEFVVWGANPHLAANTDVAQSVNLIDFASATAAASAGFSLPAIESRRAMLLRDPEALCRHLRQEPDSVRLTGPYPEGPLQWLEDSGCPSEVVRQEEWITIDFGPEWFAGTEYEGVPFGSDYATWAEWQAVLDLEAETD